MKPLFLALPLLACAIPAVASDFYLLGELGQSKYSVDSSSEDDTAFAIGAGFNISPNFAVEVAWRDFGEISEKDAYYVDANNYWREEYSFSANAFQASLLGKLPLSDVVSVYGRVGLASIDYEAGFKYEERYDGYLDRGSDSFTKTKTKALFGLGLSYQISQAFGLRLDYSRYDDYEDIEVSSTTLGLTFAL